MTHVRFGCSHLDPMGKLENKRSSDGSPDPDGSLKELVRIKIRHYRNVYLNRPDPMVFIPLTVDTTGHDQREVSVLTNELTEESDKFRFLRDSCFSNLKGSVGLIMAKTSDIRISIPLDLSSRSFIPFPRFIRSCRPTPFLVPSLVLFPPRSA